LLIRPSVQISVNLVVSNQRPAPAITLDVIPLGFAWVSHDISPV
jgi:hypothetical protein